VHVVQQSSLAGAVPRGGRDAAGRKTYEGLAAVWPQLVDDPTLGLFADRMNSMPKYVASRTLRGPLEWNATLLDGDLTTS
jgi:hypothetical protein